MHADLHQLSRNFLRVRDYRAIEGVKSAGFVKNLINLYSEVLRFLSAGILRYVGSAENSPIPLRHGSRLVGRSPLWQL